MGSFGLILSVSFWFFIRFHILVIILLFQFSSRNGEFEEAVNTFIKASTCFKFGQDFLGAGKIIILSVILLIFNMTCCYARVQNIAMNSSMLGKCIETALNIGMEHGITDLCNMDINKISRYNLWPLTVQMMNYCQ